MRDKALKQIDILINRYPALDVIKKDLTKAIEKIIESYRAGNKMMICGNGGSAADSLHIVGELMKAFVLKRQLPDDLKAKIDKSSTNPEYLKKNLQMALPTISLVNEAGLLTAYANDVAPDLNFAQQVLGQGNKGDILLAISTSGNSTNVLYAAEVAKVKDVFTIALTGKSGGKLKNLAGITIAVPETETYKIQEYHLPVYHAICLAIEAEFFAED